MDISEPIIAARVTISELFVVDAKQVQDGGVNVMDMHFIHGCLESKFIALSVGGATTCSTSCEEHAKAMGVVVTSVAIFTHRCAAKFASPNNERIIEHSPLFQIADERGDGAVNVRRELPCGGVVVRVGIPRLSVAIIDLHESDASFDESSCHQTPVGKMAAAIYLASLLWFKLDIKSVCGS